MTRDDGHHDDFDDSSTASYRAEQGRPEEPTLADRMANVPITFGTDGAGGIVGQGPAPDEPGPTPPDEAAANQRAVERGARRLEAEDSRATG